MALFALGDLHLAFGADKPMDVFPGWEDYMPRLEEGWRAAVGPGDTVVIPGDVSWAMKLEHTEADFAFIQGLPGKKLLMKGNHDYWWATRARMDKFLAEKGFDTLNIVHNDSVLAEGMAVCGTRGWLFEPGVPHDAKVMAREAGRLRASLEYARRHWPEAERLAFLHYPPLYPDAESPELIEAMREYGVKRCFYGHLHSRSSIRRAVEGEVEGICYRLVSADALGFAPLEIK